MVYSCISRWRMKGERWPRTLAHNAHVSQAWILLINSALFASRSLLVVHLAALRLLLVRVRTTLEVDLSGSRLLAPRPPSASSSLAGSLPSRASSLYVRPRQARRRPADQDRAKNRGVSFCRADRARLTPLLPIDKPRKSRTSRVPLGTGNTQHRAQ